LVYDYFVSHPKVVVNRQQLAKKLRMSEDQVRQTVAYLRGPQNTGNFVLPGSLVVLRRGELWRYDDEPTGFKNGELDNGRAQGTIRRSARILSDADSSEKWKNAEEADDKEGSYTLRIGEPTWEELDRKGKVVTFAILDDELECGGVLMKGTENSAGELRGIWIARRVAL
jgi:hypothetical protein